MISKSVKLEKFTILDGACHLFQRTGSPFWWCGFHFKGKYIRESTKKDNRHAAEAIAKLWYFKKQTEIGDGSIFNPKDTFGKVKDLALESYRGLVNRGIRSSVTLDGIEGVLNSRVTPYFKNTPVASIDNTAWHTFKQHILDNYPNSARGTLHQYKNAIRVVLNEAFNKGIIKQLPEFKDEYKTKKNENARPWFTIEEFKILKKALIEHVKHLVAIKRRQQARNAAELYCYTMFGICTGMRVGELRNMRFCDIEIKVDERNGKEILVISNIKGKRGSGICQSYFGLAKIYRSFCEMRKIKDRTTSTEKVFLVHHRIMFNKILDKTGLKFAKSNPPAKRDFVSLRATYICNRLLAGVPIYEIANNCRTSVAMIEENYAKHLGGKLMPNINREMEELDELPFVTAD